MVSYFEFIVENCRKLLGILPYIEYRTKKQHCQITKPYYIFIFIKKTTTNSCCFNILDKAQSLPIQALIATMREQ